MPPLCRPVASALEIYAHCFFGIKRLTGLQEPAKQSVSEQECESKAVRSQSPNALPLQDTLFSLYKEIQRVGIVSRAGRYSDFFSKKCRSALPFKVNFEGHLDGSVG